MLYKALLYIHVTSAVLSIGPFFLLFSTIKKLRQADEQTEQAYLDTFRFAVYLAKHAGHVLVVAGILLAVLGSWPWTTPWLLLTIIILVASLLFLARAFSPTIRKFGTPGADRQQLVDKLLRAVWIYVVLLLTMLWLMVTKPMLW
ncbi:DUF2269 family protein [Ectobacillus ponti]|uniref:DUF2269 domain-containing protein n=1 Tax=Ectobacillus ponti TaxID=2961894 RepID=A0AA41X7H6_9BACI|nr:DUF2269 domain-containing protein [Ectobacillus ponti]